MKVRPVNREDNPLFSDENMQKHVMLTIEGTVGRAVESNQKLRSIPKLQERSQSAARRIVLGIADAGLSLGMAQGSRLEARVKEILEDENATQATVATLLTRYASMLRHTRREKRRAKRGIGSGETTSAVKPDEAEELYAPDVIPMDAGTESTVLPLGDLPDAEREAV